MKICPECLQINKQIETCKTCGFPFDIKIIGKFDDYYFYEIVNLYNSGYASEAKIKLEEIKKETSNSSLNILSKKIQEVDALLFEANQYAQQAQALLKEDKIDDANKTISLAINLVNNNEFLKIKELIDKRIQELETQSRANELFKDGLKKINNNEIQTGLILLKTALDLTPNIEELKKTYDNELALFLENEVEKINDLIAIKKIDLAYYKTIELESNFPDNSILINQRKDLENRREKNRKNIVILSIILIGFCLLGIWTWQNYESYSAKLEINDNQQEQTSPSEKQKIPELNLNENYLDLIEGTWCNNKNSGSTGAFTSLEFRNENNKIYVRFYNGGPFIEYHKLEFLDDKKLVLSFDYTEGSISFNSGAEESIVSNCKNVIIGECVLLSENQLKLVIFKNQCSSLEQESTIILSKLANGEYCSFL